MVRGGFLIYHVRGHYYSVFHPSHSDPTHLGREILAEVPVDRNDYQGYTLLLLLLSITSPSRPHQFRLPTANILLEWKRVTLAFYTGEENRIQQLAKQYQRQQTIKKEAGIYDSIEPPAWGYDSKPSRTLNYQKSFSWQYIVDLDNDMLSVTGQADVTDDQILGIRFFRLDNIPRWLFDLPFVKDDVTEKHKPRYVGFGRTLAVRAAAGVHPVLVADVPGEFLAPTTRTPADPDQELLELYKSSSTEQFLPNYKLDHGSVWKSVRLLLLQQFVERFDDSLRSLRVGMNKSHFVFRQIVYAVVNLAHNGNKVLFRKQTNLYEDRIGFPKYATPWWEPPDTDTYWIGDVLIILDNAIEHSENLCAAIGRVIKVANTTGDITGIVFSHSSIVVVKVKYTEHGLQVLYSPYIPLLSTPVVYHTHGDPKCTGLTPPQGFLALLQILSPPIVPQACYLHLPVEICERIFDNATPDTQNILKLSCRLFNEIARQYPRVGGWKLLEPEDCPSKFSGVPAIGGYVQNLRIKTGYLHEQSGYEVGVCGRTRILSLDMLMWNVKLSTEDECECRTPTPYGSPSEDEENFSSDEDFY